MAVVKNNGPTTKELCNGQGAFRRSVIVKPGQTATVSDEDLQILMAGSMVKSLFANNIFSVVPEPKKAAAPAPKPELVKEPVAEKPKGKKSKAKKEEF
jgi:hypothetical protein